MLASNIVIENEGRGRPLVAPGRLLQFSLVTSLFFMWGVPNNLNDVLIRQFMKSFALNRVEAGLVQSAFYLGYFFLAIPAALIETIIFWMAASWIFARIDVAVAVD